MTRPMKWVQENLYIPISIQSNIYKTLVIVILMRLLYTFLKKILYRVIDNDKIYYKGKKFTSFGSSLVGVILIGRIWFEGVGSFMTFIGLFSAALAIVMKDVILNLAGWVYIMLKGPFKVGDRIEIDHIIGDVIDVQLFTTSIMEIRGWIYGDKYTGRIIDMPNFLIFKKPVYNFNSQTDFIWNELKIAISYESNWERAKKILEDIAIKNTEKTIPMAEANIKRAARMFSLLDSNFSPKIYTTINHEHANITFIIRYICHYRSKRGSAQRIYEDILKGFKNHEDIKFSYPVNRIYYENEEK